MRCKHQNGELLEFVEAAHCREVIDGELEEEGTNSLGNILYYEYYCFDCGKHFRYGAIPKQGWLKKIHEQLT